MEKKSILLYIDQCEKWNMMTDEDAGKMIKSIMQYAKTGEVTEFNYPLNLVFLDFKMLIDRDNDAYDRKVQSCRENGSKGGRPKKENPENPVGYLGYEEKPKKGDTVKVTVKDTDTVTDKDMFFKRAMDAQEKQTKAGKILTFYDHIEPVYLTAQEFAILCQMYDSQTAYDAVRMRAEQKKELKIKKGNVYKGIEDKDFRIIKGYDLQKIREYQAKQQYRSTQQQSETPSSYDRDELEDFWNRH